MGKVYVLAETAAEFVYAIGPIDDVGDRVSDLKDAIEAHGWTPRGTVYPLTRTEFRRMQKARREQRQST